MAEELYFIKTNPTIAKINLYNKLEREEENILKFLPSDAKDTLESIKNKVKDSVEELTQEELLLIFQWFSKVYSSDHEETKIQLFINGIDLFYEIPTTVHAENFLQILSDYEKLLKQDMNYIVDSKNFNQFLIYGIFLTEIINRDQHQDNILCEYLKPDNQSLYLLAENQCGSTEFDGKIIPDLQHHFTDLYDLTKFYKGSIIKLENQ
ncbi:hypothetical protein HNP24_002508 [Chryseobacterium sediminis]|uniref:PI3K/PI4K catalytic domain-containing protein n=1 Tax=Chryseobacterium sediminis TaxID=1679494 RepID=A0ABR6Q0U7_9FLAO|nr:hypothetical protein [Chryseobacterium sediminis]MBB6331558.1 hypothetical protein [Chryseobacterium sediminis]